MPLKPGSSPQVISQNIDELTHHGSRLRSHKQIVAIALSNADRSKTPHMPSGTPHPRDGSVETPHPIRRKEGY